MSTAKTRQRMRFAFGATSFDSEKDIITTKLAKSWRGADVQVEAAIFDGTTLVDDVSNIETLILSISAGGSGLADAPLLQLTADAAALNAALTAQLWTAGDEDDCIYMFEITKENMQFTFGSLATDNRRELRLTLHGVTTDTPERYITYGFASWTVMEDGVQNDLEFAGGTLGTVRVSGTGDLQFKNPDTAAWHNVTPVVVDGILSFEIDQSPA